MVDLIPTLLLIVHKMCQKKNFENRLTSSKIWRMTKWDIFCNTLYIAAHIQGGPKNQTCLSVDNSATVSDKKRVIRQKFQNAVKNKRQICIVKHLNIFCLICINIRHPRNSAKFHCNTWI